MIEFSQSSLEKDTEEKRIVYAQADIADYWVVNLRDHCLIVYRDPAEGDYQATQTLYAGTLFPLAFPDVAIPIDHLLRQPQ